LAINKPSVILSLRRTFFRQRRLDYCKLFNWHKVLRKLRMTGGLLVSQKSFGKTFVMPGATKVPRPRVGSG